MNSIASELGTDVCRLCHRFTKRVRFTVRDLEHKLLLAVKSDEALYKVSAFSQYMEWFVGKQQLRARFGTEDHHSSYQTTDCICRVGPIKSPRRASKTTKDLSMIRNRTEINSKILCSLLFKHLIVTIFGRYRIQRKGHKHTWTWMAVELMHLYPSAQLRLMDRFRVAVEMLNGLYQRITPFDGAGYWAHHMREVYVLIVLAEIVGTFEDFATHTIALTVAE